MRRDKWLACLLSVILCLTVSFAGVMCLQSAFGLQANIAHLLLGCAISAALFSIGFTTKWWYIPLLLAAPVAGYLWQKGILPGSVEWLLYQVSSTYDKAYHCGVLYWSAEPPALGDATAALCLAGSIVCFTGAWTVCRKKPAIFAALTAMLPLAACFVVTDRVPQARYLYCLFFGVAVLLLCQLTRRKNIKKGNALTLLVTIPVALAVAVLFWAVPQDTYQGQDRADRILTAVQAWVEDLGEQGPAGTSADAEQTVALNQVGRLVQTHTPVMTVHADQVSGMLYLRQQGFQMYNGTSWYNEHSNNIYHWVKREQLESIGQVEITTRKLHLMQFVPYYTQDASVNQLGFTENTQAAYTYTFYVFSLPADAPSSQIHESTGGLMLPVGTYTPDAISLPAGTVDWAEPVVQPLIAGKYTVKDRAEAIGAYVRGLADYDRNTARMPAGETDFAQWFAEDADTGYCVHFATTAAVLLRAAGIQAQYVEGYAISVAKGTTATVYEDQAHAWVEYYDPAVGWRILECTPPEGLPTYVYLPQDTTQTTQNPSEPVTGPTQAPQGSDVQPPVNPQAGNTLYWILGALCAVAAIPVQWQLRLRRKRRLLARGTVNQQAVQLWLEVSRLARLLKQRPDPQLYQLAQKAKFSQHMLTAGELAMLTDTLTEYHQALKARPWYFQPIYMLIFAIY